MEASEKTPQAASTVHAAKWGQERRLEFIDFRLLWDGRVNRSDLTAHFGISVPQASMDLARYQEVKPQNMRYDKQQKTYIATPSFAPLSDSVNAYSFLNAIRQVEAQILAKESTFLGWYPSTGVIRLPLRQVDVDILRFSLQSIRRSSKICIRYQSMNRPEPSDRFISPHAIVFDGVRWHLRGFCYEHQEFRDFVISRITKIYENDSTLLGIEAHKDEAWFRFVTVTIGAAPHLSEGQRRAVEADYGMKDGCLSLKTREALLLYLLQQLPLYSPIGRSKHNHIVLQNRDELQPHMDRLGIDID
jgi:predicted DNA-binding transcriptional regulator YafY